MFYNLGAHYDAYTYNPGSSITPTLATPLQTFTPPWNPGRDPRPRAHTVYNFNPTHLSRIPSPGAVLNKTINDQMIDKICNITVLGIQPGVMNATVPGGTCNKTNNFWSNTYWNDTFTLSLQPETNMTDRYTYCHYYLSTVIPYGSWHWATRNSVVCRLIHVQLTYTVPQIHCRHVGPPGDPYCIDWPQVSCSPLAALSLFQIAVQCPTQA